MTDDLSEILGARAPDPARPLAGLTILVVEDSRFACEALRLLCLRSGARIRRADCMASARRHLATYRPSALIVDLGLPDGSGLDLIAEVSAGRLAVRVVLAASGDPDLEDAAHAAGASGFLVKPISGLAAFQAAILSALPAEEHPLGRRAIPATQTPDAVVPDGIALRDDLAHAESLLASEQAGPDELAYVAQFLHSLARAAQDRTLAEASTSFAIDPANSRGRLSDLVRTRLGAQAAL